MCSIYGGVHYTACTVGVQTWRGQVYSVPVSTILTRPAGPRRRGL